MKKIFYLFLITGLCSCNKYLDVKPKGYTLLNTVTDYDQWLNGGTDEVLITGLGIGDIDYMADNIDNPLIQKGSTNPIDLIYTWSSQFVLDLTQPPAMWSSFYGNIYYFNAVINGVMSAEGGTDQQKKELYAEALLGRAFEYLYLTNLYGKEYDSATADNDLAVPFVTSSDISESVPQRSSVKQMYDRIISDLQEAILNLQDDNSSNKFRGSKASAYSVLARAYLYARDYVDAAKNAQLALSSGTALSLLNYNTSTVLPAVNISPEAIYARAWGYGHDETMPFTFPYVTPAFLSNYDTTDLRLKIFYGTSSVSGTNSPSAITNFSVLKQRGAVVFSCYASQATAYQFKVNSGTSVPEMKLIIAEDAARSGDIATALQQLNELRQNRFRAQKYAPLESNDKLTVLNWVLRERQLELPVAGFRWFDMRRLAGEGLIQSVNKLDGAGNIIATLAPNSSAYTLQIPDQVLHFNPGMTQNPL